MERNEHFQRAADDGTDVTITDSQWADLLERLSDRLLGGFPIALWRSAFLGRAYDGITFRRVPLTFLCTESLGGEWSEQDVAVLAARHDGRVELCGAATLLSFADAEQALRVAMLLQHMSGQRLRIALSGATCDVACFHAEGAERRVALGAAVEAAARSLELATVGTIHVCGDTFRQLEAAIDRHAHQAVLSTEVQDGRVVAAEITLPPPRQAALSTFAGLGLT